jgi:imidazolonepropionase
MLLTHATLARMTGGYGLIPDAGVVLDGDRILWAGPMADLPRDLRAEAFDCGGRLVTPGLIDCHTRRPPGGGV